MAYTRHGYHISGTNPHARKPTIVVDCGGPGVCDSCTRECGRAQKDQPTDRVSAPAVPVEVEPDGKVVKVKDDKKDKEDKVKPEIKVIRVLGRNGEELDMDFWLNPGLDERSPKIIVEEFPVTNNDKKEQD